MPFKIVHFLTLLTTFLLVPAAVSAAARPNIVFVLCDDLGYGDVQCLNPQGKIATPHMDRLATAGMIFTDAHSGSAVCSPTRYGLMTGRYAWRSRLQLGVLGGLSPRLIEPGRLTVAAFLKQQGYHTACVGKWHLGMDWVKLPGKEVAELSIESAEQVHNVDYAQPIANGPTTLGFDEYFGISASLDMVPYTFISNDRCAVVPTINRRFPFMPDREGDFTRLGPAAPEFKAEKVLPTLTRRAIDCIARQAPAARDGQPFFLYLPLASPHTPISTKPEWQGKSGLNPYADFVMQTDDSIGQVVAAIDHEGLAENTLVIVTSDNGCSPQAKFDELLPQGHNPNHFFRGNKADIYEGGHRVPFIARWPSKIPAGAQSGRLICLTDFFATCADLLGVPLPATEAEDSVSFLPALFRDPTESPRSAVVHHSINGSFAIREGNWKLALCPGSGGWTAPRPGIDDTTHLPLVQLFDLNADIGETTNKEQSTPEVVYRLTALLEQFVAEGRSTPGEKQSNTVPVDIWKAGKAAHEPAVKKK